MNITWIGSPNFDSNRVPIDRIVIHWFGDSGTIHNHISSVDRQFNIPGNTAAHYAVENQYVHQYVSESNVGYHSGNGAMNQRSIGIEHSAGPNRQASEETYRTSGKLIADISKRHNIPIDRTHIIKHNEVVPTQCCGTVDIDKLIRIAKSEASNTSSNIPMDDLKNRIQELEQVKKQLEGERDKLNKAIFEKDKQIEGLQKTILAMETDQRAKLAEIEIECQRKIEQDRQNLMIEYTNKEKEYKKKIEELEKKIELSSDEEKLELLARIKQLEALNIEEVHTKLLISQLKIRFLKGFPRFYDRILEFFNTK